MADCENDCGKEARYCDNCLCDAVFEAQKVLKARLKKTRESINTLIGDIEDEAYDEVNRKPIIDVLYGIVKEIKP